MEKKEYIIKLHDLYDKANPKPKMGPSQKQEHMLKMTDGTRLRTICWFPKQKENLSVVFTRTCYPHQEVELALHAQEYSKRGFGFVVQWCRGVNGSEGKWEPNTFERRDGLDTINWIAALPFVKNIGYWGNSYLASAGWCMADAVPDKVKSMYLGVYGTDRYTSVYQDGLFRQDIFTAWAMENAGVKIDTDYLESCRYRPQMLVDEELWNTRLDWYRDWIDNTDRASDYWSGEGFWKMLQQIPEKVKIPLFIKEGWYDHHLGSAMAAYSRLSEVSKAASTLQIGPWRHWYDYVLEGHEIRNLQDDSVSSPLGWFYRTLIQEQIPDKTCEWYLIGADEWITYGGEAEHKESLYLDALNMGNCGMLSHNMPAEGAVEYLYNPRAPVMSHGAESCFHTVKEIGSLFQPECGYREDVLSFVSEPYRESFDIIGNIEVCLYVCSDAEDTAFTAKVMEIFEDGRAVNIRGSITTLAYRNEAGRRQSYEPGKIEEIHIKMWPIAWRIKPGSRLRLDISSSDFPQYAVHSNYPGIWSRQRKSKCANQTVYTGAAYPSEIILPVKA